MQPEKPENKVIQILSIHTRIRRTSIPGGQKTDSKSMKMERLNFLWGFGKGNVKNPFLFGSRIFLKVKSKRLN
jgi:hypothetical protein